MDEPAPDRIQVGYGYGHESSALMVSSAASGRQWSHHELAARCNPAGSGTGRDGQVHRARARFPGGTLRPPISKHDPLWPPGTATSSRLSLPPAYSQLSTAFPLRTLDARRSTVLPPAFPLSTLDSLHPVFPQHSALPRLFPPTHILPHMSQAQGPDDQTRHGRLGQDETDG